MSDAMFSTSQQGDVTVLTFNHPNFMHDENEQLLKSFDEVLAKGHKKIVIDFASCSYISSLILASLVYLHNKTKDLGGGLAFCNIQARVKEIMEMTRLDRVFNMAASKDEAIAQLGKKS
jgi:anti-sigma B factor antagonist